MSPICLINWKSKTFFYMVEETVNECDQWKFACLKDLIQKVAPGQ